MNFTTLLIILVVAVLLVLDLKYLKRHGIEDCTGSCGSCHGSCKWSDDIHRAQKSIARRDKIKKMLHLS